MVLFGSSRDLDLDSYYALEVGGNRSTEVKSANCKMGDRRGSRLFDDRGDLYGD